MSETPLLLAEAAATLRAFLRDMMICLRFYSRIPLPVFSFERDAHDIIEFPRAMRMLPIASILIGSGSALALLVLYSCGLPTLVCAIGALAVLVRTTGAMHEDGLADTADGLGGGASRERKLAIMRDSRLGTYGAVALTLALVARMAALSGLIERFGPWAAAGAIIGGAAVSRVFGLLPLCLLTPARADGAAHSAGQPTLESLAIAAGMAILFAIAFVAPAAGWGVTIIACLLAAAGSLYLVHLGRRHLGGQTGDVAGAAQQCAEIAFLAGLLIKGPLG